MEFTIGEVYVRLTIDLSRAYKFIQVRVIEPISDHEMQWHKLVISPTSSVKVTYEKQVYTKGDKVAEEIAFKG